VVHSEETGRRVCAPVRRQYVWHAQDLTTINSEVLCSGEVSRMTALGGRAVRNAGSQEQKTLSNIDVVFEVVGRFAARSTSKTVFVFFFFFGKLVEVPGRGGRIGFRSEGDPVT